MKDPISIPASQKFHVSLKLSSCFLAFPYGLCNCALTPATKAKSPKLQNHTSIDKRSFFVGKIKIVTFNCKQKCNIVQKLQICLFLLILLVVVWSDLINGSAVLIAQPWIRPWLTCSQLEWTGDLKRWPITAYHQLTRIKYQLQFMYTSITIIYLSYFTN